MNALINYLPINPSQKAVLTASLLLAPEEGLGSGVTLDEVAAKVPNLKVWEVAETIERLETYCYAVKNCWESITVCEYLYIKFEDIAKKQESEKVEVLVSTYELVEVAA